MTAPQKIDPIINLKDASILVVEPTHLGMEILSQIMMGFGAKNLLKATGYEEAMAIAQNHPLDLILIEAALEKDGPDGYEFVRWLRRSGPEPNAFAPVVIISAHTAHSKVVSARDCGANFFVLKPLSPAVLLNRILWIARQKRPYVSCKVYAGPDRRFKNDGPPPNSDGRRENDLSAEVGDATEPNMSQKDVDGLIQPTRVSF